MILRDIAVKGRKSRPDIYERPVTAESTDIDEEDVDETESIADDEGHTDRSESLGTPESISEELVEKETEDSTEAEIFDDQGNRVQNSIELARN